MKNIATPIITKQANGSFAENTNEINRHQISASYHELIYQELLTQNKNSHENDFSIKSDRIIICPTY